MAMTGDINCLGCNILTHTSYYRPVARGSLGEEPPSQIKGPLFYQKAPLFSLKKPQICQRGALFCLKKPQIFG